jgi:hypothetical protein
MTGPARGHHDFYLVIMIEMYLKNSGLGVLGYIDLDDLVRQRRKRVILKSVVLPSNSCFQPPVPMVGNDNATAL